MEFKLKTYKEIAQTEDDYNLLKASRNEFAYYPTAPSFLYDLNTKIFYDAITCDEYRDVTHSYIFEKFGLEEVKEGTLNHYLRLVFSTEGYINEQGDITGNFIHCDLGIAGLETSHLYNRFLDISILDELTAYDLDLIESYIGSLIQEVNEIRRAEPKFVNLDNN